MALNKKWLSLERNSYDISYLYLSKMCVYDLFNYSKKQQMLLLRSKLMYASVVATSTSMHAQTLTPPSPAKDRGNM